MDPLVQLAVLQPVDLDVFQNILLKWSYVLHARNFEITVPVWPDTK
jgi:hypothetical protein